MKLLTQTNTALLSVGLLLLRWVAGVIIFVAGGGKLFGWFGGIGIQTTLKMFKAEMDIPAVLIYLSCYTELIGGLFLVVGFLTRPAAFALVINMLVATISMGTKNFFMGGGAYPFSLMISFLLILLAGPMAYSIDAWLMKKNKEQLINN